MEWLISLISEWLNYLWPVFDILTVVVLIYGLLSLSSDRRTLLMVRGFIFLLIANLVVRQIGLRESMQKLPMLVFVLNSLLVGVSVALAVLLQSEIRRFLEHLGTGDFSHFLQSSPKKRASSRSDAIIDELVDATRELSQNRTGALMIIELGEPITENEISVPGVRLEARLSKELLQTIFQTSTLLHDGAVLIRGEQVIAAGVILPLSERKASREIGTRHRAAMGITERIGDCFCIVVSEETGSIGVAEFGKLERPIASSKLREILEGKLKSPTPVTLVGSVPRFKSLKKVWQKILTHYQSRK